MSRFRFRSAASRRRRLRRTVLPAVALLVLAAAVTAAAAVRDANTVEVVSFYPEGAPDYGNLVAINQSFEATHPGIKTKLTFGGGAAAPNIVARFRAGNPPEVNVGFFGQGPEGRAYATSGQLVDLTNAMNKVLPKSYGYGPNTKWKNAMLPLVKPFVTLNGRYYAAPSEITAITVFYNRVIFKKAGLTAPTTWAEFLAVCKKLKSRGVAPLTVTGTFNGYMQLYFDYLLARRVGTAAPLAAIAGKRSFASIPGVGAAANDLQTIVKNGYFLKGFQATDFTAAQLNFFQGKAAMMVMGTWLEGEMKDSIPPDFQLGTFPFPQIPGGKGQGVIFGAVNDRTVASKSPNPQLGVEWLRYEARKDIQAARIKYLQYISPYKGVKTTAKYALLQKSLAAKDSAFALDYFGVFGQSKSVRDAYQVPIAKLFFGQINAQEMVKEISDGLSSAAR
jgi:raffinose/stachyose/melibiose transport system substrate-binding protein